MLSATFRTVVRHAYLSIISCMHRRLKKEEEKKIGKREIGFFYYAHNIMFSLLTLSTDIVQCDTH